MVARNSPSPGHALALDLFSGLAGSYDEALDLATVFQDRRWKKWVVEEARLKEARKVLDVGCGSLVLEEKFVPGSCRVVGLDLTSEMLSMGLAKRLGVVDGLLNGDAELLPFADESFDSVVSCYVAKYVKLQSFVNELARVTKPGGIVAFYDFVKPRGVRGALIRAYLRGVIVPTGELLRLRRSPAAKTFLEISEIVENSVWDCGADRIVSSAGLRIVSEIRMTGIVTAISTVKEP